MTFNKRMMTKNSWFRGVFFIGWWSLILFLVDFARRTGKWWFYLIALLVFVFTIIGIIQDIKSNNKNDKK